MIIIKIILMFFLQIKQIYGHFNTPECIMKVNCSLPRCNCDSTKTPVNFLKYHRKDEIPQLVVLTIDDDRLDIKSYQAYKRLLDNSSIRVTFFVSDSHNETSYCLTRNLYENNNEIAISTVNYTCPRKFCSADRDFKGWNYLVWLDQILNMRYEIKSPLNNEGPSGTFPGLWELPVPTYVNYDNDESECVRIVEGQCKIDKTVNGIARFFRQHFLRAYYQNRAPIVIHLNSDWLKEFVTIAETELIPNIGFANIEKRKIIHERKEYRNLDGLIKFIEKTLENNKDVYFVTAQQAIDWVRMLPRVEEDKQLNLTHLIEEIIGDVHFKQDLNGKCDFLGQTISDYDSTESLYMDDDSGNRLKKDFIDKLNDTVLAGLQSEVLFVNPEVLYLMIGACLTIVLIVFYDKIYK